MWQGISINLKNMKLIQIQTIVEKIAENIRHISDTPNILVKAFIIF